MACVMAGRDSVVVLPTGGGKSLCFQAPAMALKGTAIVVSPLISLMKDQVDGLTECGVPAARLDSSLPPEQQKGIEQRLLRGELKLLYVAPERLVSESFLATLKKVTLSLIAVDEAHCVSMWGHDFRPEYRRLSFLRQTFPDIAVHAYTATATPQVRDDIGSQLQLRNPAVLVGSCDRPNLVYKVARRVDVVKQVLSVLDGHPNESGIVYCLRRDDVDQLCLKLRNLGYPALPYHAGLEKEERKNNQDSFMSEKTSTIVATIAFGMGIDKSNVRYVVHTGMPKSLEHYQQESGRAGRDGLEADCCLLYSGSDWGFWNRLLSDQEPEVMAISRSKLNGMYDYCNGIVCRHEAILNYFGQGVDKTNCQACDVCLGELETVNNSLEIGQQILSCVIRLREQFGADYTGMVLVGSREKRVLENRHDSLSTYGLLSGHAKRNVRDWIEQLVSQGYIEKSGEYNTLSVTQEGRLLLKGEDSPRLLKPVERSKRDMRATSVTGESWEGVDRELFEQLRILRRKLADERNVPAFVVFGDAALRDMARLKPTTSDQFLEVRGVGEVKRQQYGRAFLSEIKEYIRVGETASPGSQG